MTLTIVSAIAIVAVVSIHYIIQESKKSKKQKKMLKNIESLLKEIRKLNFFFKEFGDIESFTVCLENSAKRLYHGSLSSKEFEEYKISFKDEMQNKYKTLLSEIIFVNPNIKKILNPEYFGKIN